MLSFLLVSSKYGSKSIIYITAKWVLSNTNLDEKTEHCQVTISKEKYKNSEYDDNTVESLMKYLELEL
jgi:hypothetical protein